MKHNLTGLTEEMLHKLAVDIYENWDGDLIIDELIWLYSELSRLDKDLYKQLIENANSKGVVGSMVDEA